MSEATICRKCGTAFYVGSDLDEAVCDLCAQEIAADLKSKLACFNCGDGNTPLYCANCAAALGLKPALAFVQNHVDEVRNEIGGVIGYRLDLTPEETERLWKILEGKEP